MSSNLFNGGRLCADAYVKASDMKLQPPMILSSVFGDLPTDGLVKGEMTYRITNLNDGANIDLLGWEAILLPIAILQDALHRESVLNSIRKPTREQLDELRGVMDKLGALVPNDLRNDGGSLVSEGDA